MVNLIQQERISSGQITTVIVVKEKVPEIVYNFYQNLSVWRLLYKQKKIAKDVNFYHTRIIRTLKQINFFS